MYTMERLLVRSAGIVMGTALSVSTAFASDGEYVIKSGHDSLKEWLLPDTPPHPENNKPTAERVELGKKLFFDPRLSGDGNMSCASCHNPVFGWSDALPTGKGFQSMRSVGC